MVTWRYNILCICFNFKDHVTVSLSVSLVFLACFYNFFHFTFFLFLFVTHALQLGVFSDIVVLLYKPKPKCQSYFNR
ncbi:hypothetical protein Pint_11118 [Pistacia integerrima]|uniref:Uncharacterized protein n=1 Tax=Pistacia integerrima TaxID=434235 RepID=A0ACC0XM78_9ROSI|nr:hypothetical protein Pint_11118 [Pistacia integerrima]